MKPPGSLLDADSFVRMLQSRKGLQTGCLEDIAFKKGWINADQLHALTEPLQESGYGAYLFGLIALDPNRASGNADCIE